MTDKLLFTAKLLFALAIIAGLLALGSSQAESLSVRQVQARGGLNVRAAPSIEARALYSLEDTDTVIALAEQGGWVYVARNNGAHTPLGWVCGDYLK